MAAPNKTKAAPTKDPQIKKPKSASGSVNAATEVDTTSRVSPASGITLIEYGSGKPNKAAYNKEQERIKAEIEPLQVKLNIVKEKINLAKGDPINDRRSQIRKELGEIRKQQSDNKLNRRKVAEQLRVLQEGIQRNMKELNFSRTKFKSVEEVDAHISNLERQLESRKLKIGDEKRTVEEISNMRRLRRIVERFQVKQADIDREREQEAQLRAQLNDPEVKAISERYEKLKAEFDDLKGEGVEAIAKRSKLFGERKTLQGEIDGIFILKKESHQRFKDANDRYRTKAKEDQASREKTEENRAKVKEDQAKVKKEDRTKAKVKVEQTKVNTDQTKVKADQAKVKADQAKVKIDQTKRGERMGQQRTPQEQQKLVGWTLPIPEYQTKTRDRQMPTVSFSKGTKGKGPLQGKTNAPLGLKKKPRQRCKGANEGYWVRSEDLTRQHKAAEEQQKLDLDEMIREGLYQVETQDRKIRSG